MFKIQKKNMKALTKRWNAKTPKFWKTVQKIGLAAGAVGAVIVAAPVALPAAVITIGGYLVTAGSITAALSQLTVEGSSELDEKEAG
jgi:ABC-type protease/lipase transport system fused ATPase/permease subunit